VGKGRVANTGSMEQALALLQKDLTGRFDRLEKALDDRHKDFETRLRAGEQFRERIVGVLLLVAFLGAGSAYAVLRAIGAHDTPAEAKAEAHR
jgi:hypothetical protein